MLRDARECTGGIWGLSSGGGSHQPQSKDFSWIIPGGGRRSKGDGNSELEMIIFQLIKFMMTTSMATRMATRMKMRMATRMTTRMTRMKMMMQMRMRASVTSWCLMSRQSRIGSRRLTSLRRHFSPILFPSFPLLSFYPKIQKHSPRNPKKSPRNLKKSFS